MTKKLTSAIGILLLTTSVANCDARDRALRDARAALTLAVEQNLGVRSFRDRCSGMIRRPDVEAVVVAVPLNREVVQAAVAYRAALEELAPETYSALRDRSVARYLLGDQAAFALLVYADRDPDDDAIVRLGDPSSGIEAKTEDASFPLVTYTRIFDEDLGPGVSRGFLYFENFRDADLASYSLHIQGFDARACPRSTAIPRAFAFSYDESELGFLGLLEDGLSIEEIRRTYEIQDGRIDADLLLALIGLLLNAVSIAV